MTQQAPPVADVEEDLLPQELNLASVKRASSPTGRAVRRTTSGALVSVDSSPRRSTIEWIVVAGAAALMALIVRTSVLQLFYIPSESMSHTLEVNDKVLVDKLSWHLTGIHRGDIVVFHRPENLHGTDVKDLVKRVIATEGDTVEAVDGQVFVNDVELSEDYLVKQDSTLNLPRTTVGANQLFMMGDNRERSSDSRVFGAIPESSVVGRARVVVLHGKRPHFTWL